MDSIATVFMPYSLSHAEMACKFGYIYSKRAVVVLGAVGRNADLHDTVRDIYSHCIGIDYPKFRTFGGLDFFAFFAMIILLLLLMDKGISHVLSMSILLYSL